MQQTQQATELERVWFSSCVSFSTIKKSWRGFNFQASADKNRGGSKSGGLKVEKLDANIEERERERKEWGDFMIQIWKAGG